MYVWFHEIIIVGLKLDDIEVGIYNVHCLPLRLLRAEGTPIRYASSYQFTNQTYFLSFFSFY
ncbi:putative kynurenine formamidase superfamily [Helianthus anomalus]